MASAAMVNLLGNFVRLHEWNDERFRVWYVKLQDVFSLCQVTDDQVRMKAAIFATDGPVRDHLRIFLE